LPRIFFQRGTSFSSFFIRATPFLEDASAGVTEEAIVFPCAFLTSASIPGIFSLFNPIFLF